MTKIEWTNETWNPVIGCTYRSEGCDNCYAERFAKRLARMQTTKEYSYVVDDKGWNGEFLFQSGKINKPLHWKKPRMIFVCSMSDMFHPMIPWRWIDEVFDGINKAPQHTYQILTKRPQVMRHYFRDRNITELPSNIWLGVTAENQKWADLRIPYLLRTPAAVKFVSCEPLLGPIDLRRYYYRSADGTYPFKHLNEKYRTRWTDLLNWVIVGGESGPNARPMHPDWVRSIRNQCQASGTPFFFKQWGEWIEVGKCGNQEHSIYYNARDCQRLNLEGGQGFHGEKAVYMKNIGKKKAGRLLNGHEYNEFPNVQPRHGVAQLITKY